MFTAEDAPFMKSKNFEFLRGKRAALANFGGFAETYVYSDPESAVVNLRKFVEQVVFEIYQAYRIYRPFEANLNDLLGLEAFKQSVPVVVQQKIHAIRISGNQGSHVGRPLSSETALDRLREAFDVGQWVHLKIFGGTRAEFGPYLPPTPNELSNGKAKEALEQLKIAEAKHDALLAELEEERKKRVEVEQAVALSEGELQNFREEGQKIANVLQFNELTTRRRLIDQRLVDAGWDVGPNGINTEEVGQEVKLTEHPTPSGEGYADYVLYGEDGKPLAVVEAKRTAKEPRLGAEQARIYAMCLEKATGQRPAIFFTNGLDVFLWDDAQGYAWRKVQGFYSKDSLEYLIEKRQGKKPLATIEPNLQIADRMYQLEAIKRVSERFTNKSRKALVVQATGTGKTRVAISLCDLLMRGGWVKRILFLCDRRELRKQADLRFKEFMPNEPRATVSSATGSDRTKRIYLATYPAMMKCYEGFDVGFFDLIVADESHRSIYNRYGRLFRYFDALQVGLTATPVNYIERNTYPLFDCEDRDPTAHFSFEDAINSNPACLVPFRVRAFRSRVREKGFKYSQMSEEQRAQLEQQDDAPALVDFEPHEVDRDVFNKDTTRNVWRSLMEEGIRDATNSKVGKTIVFARNHNHAVHLQEVFQELYPQYGSTFCRVIDNQEKRAEQLIDDFKVGSSELTIAISVDMLDTGIDVPEIVNLVFAKRVQSYVKFWQMIGRGTRLCNDLFGPGKNKTEFLIFDHWSNFWFFDEKYKEKEPSRQKSLLQHLFEARLAIADAALQKMNERVFQATVDLIVDDIVATRNTGTIEVRDQWRELEQLSERERIAQFAAVTRDDLLSVAAPLMQWRTIRGEEDAYRFDLLISRVELEVLRAGAKGPTFQDLKARVEEQVELLMKNQNPVKAKAATIATVRSKAFWDAVTVPTLEEVRLELRGIMKYQQQMPSGRLAPQVFDVMDADVSAQNYTPKMSGLDLAEYRRRVESVVRQHFADNSLLQRVRAGKIVKEEELEELARLVLQIDDKANVMQLAARDPGARKSLLTVFRSIVGLDPVEVEKAFTQFVHKHPKLSAQQLRFLQVLQNFISQNGGIEIESLYESPFTIVHAESVDGVFPNRAEVDDLFVILEAFQPKVAPPSTPPPESKRAS